MAFFFFLKEIGPFLLLLGRNRAQVASDTFVFPASHGPRHRPASSMKNEYIQLHIGFRGVPLACLPK